MTPASISPEIPIPIPEITKAEVPPARPNLASTGEAQTYLEKLHTKIGTLAGRFAAGNINRRQFEELYAHYQREIQEIEGFLAVNPVSEEWKNAVTEGQSILIRRRAAAKLVGFSIYDNLSSMPIKTQGDFGVDPALFVPMLVSYRSAAEEIFGSGVRSTQIEGGRLLCFIPGKITTTLALFSNEPSGKQLKTLEDVHHVFEHANYKQLNQRPIDVNSLACLHEFFMNQSF
jgi:hypothetical protein